MPACAAPKIFLRNLAQFGSCDGSRSAKAASPRIIVQMNSRLCFRNDLFFNV